MPLTALTLALAPALTPAQEIRTFYPEEEAPHEGTWLSWPHHYTYGVAYRNALDDMWVDMTAALVDHGNVHILAYNASQVTRITGLLNTGGVPLGNVDFLIRPTDDCWVRDNGPIFVYGPDGDLQIGDWGFNGWGLDTPFALDDPVPSSIGSSLGLPVVDLDHIVLEGGAIEVDGNGAFMATRSSILEPDRNPGLSEAALEAELSKQLGVTKFIWLDGQPGGQFDITDMHIDGFARFSGRTIVTMSSADLAYWGLSGADIATLFAATDVNGDAYDFLELPLTQNNVVTTYGMNLGFKGSYVNYYVSNDVVLVPTYADPNDAPALALLQQHFPEHDVTGIDSRNLYREGGMVHCVTQQQPLADPAGLGVAFGQGCPTPPLTIESYTTPNLGRTLVIGIHGVPPTATVAVLLAGSQLSIPLDGIGLENCTLYSSGTWTLSATIDATTGHGVAHAPVPSNPAFLGTSATLQLGAAAPGATSGGLVTSNALRLTVQP